MIYLLDTNHCSRIIDGNLQILQKPHLLQEKDDTSFAISSITRGELVFMVAKSKQQEENEKKTAVFLNTISLCLIDDAIADCYGTLKAQLLKHFGPKKDTGKRSKTTIQKLGFGENDLWIAATAIAYGMTIVSADSDFVRIQEVRSISLENWLS